jgi:glycosyltransferase involved in cell wall biosynthesis
MKIILFAHPNFLGSQSMPRYASMIKEGMIKRGHTVQQLWTPKPYFYNLPCRGNLKKWLGYVDQYVLFPLEVKFKLRECSTDTLFVFADQALGPWVPLVRDRLHIVHCHDFLALKSALGTIPENPTSGTGKIYQNFIRKGFSKGRNFISISQKTQDDLHLLHQGKIEISEVGYNGLNRPFQQLEMEKSRVVLGGQLQLDLSKGYIVHVGGNQYYKNRKGVIAIYSAWRSTSPINLPLLLIGEAPSAELEKVSENSLFKKDIHFIKGLADEFINMVYSGASCLLFPSLDEGFGWPIAEAMACGCPVITTDEAPMTEVAGQAAFLISRKPMNPVLVNDWAVNSAKQISKIMELSEGEKQLSLNAGFNQVKKFNAAASLDKIEEFYELVLNTKNKC